MVDIGTTTLQLARQLRDRELTVITSSLAVLEELLPCEGIELDRRSAGSSAGTTARSSACSPRTRCASSRRTSRSSARAGSGDDLSVMDTTMVEVPIKRGMIAGGERVVLLADAAKFSMGGIVRVCGAEELDAVVTDAPAGEPAVSGLARARASRSCTHEDRAARRRRLPRSDGLRRPARARAAGSGSTRSRSTT